MLRFFDKLDAFGVIGSCQQLSTNSISWQNDESYAIEVTARRSCTSKRFFGVYKIFQKQTLCNANQTFCIVFAGLYVKGYDVTNLASMCKLKAARLMREVMDSCLQYWGGMGYTDDCILTRFYRFVFSRPFPILIYVYICICSEG